MERMEELKDEMITMMYTIWINKFGLQHSDKLLEAFEYLYSEEKNFKEIVELAGDLCLMKHAADLGLI